MNKKIILTVISVIYLIILLVGAFAVNLGTSDSVPVFLNEQQEEN